MNRTIWAFAPTLTLASCAQGGDDVETAAKPGGDRSAKAVSAHAGVPGISSTVSSDGASGDAEAEFKEAMSLSAYSRVEYRDVQGETTTLLIGPDRKIAAKMTTELLQKQPDTASAVAALERWVNSQK